jgi:hypothetical protein
LGPRTRQLSRELARGFYERIGEGFGAAERHGWRSGGKSSTQGRSTVEEDAGWELEERETCTGRKKNAESEFGWGDKVCAHGTLIRKPRERVGFIYLMSGDRMRSWDIFFFFFYFFFFLQKIIDILISRFLAITTGSTILVTWFDLIRNLIN